MVKRYEGNSGRVVSVPEPEAPIGGPGPAGPGAPSLPGARRPLSGQIPRPGGGRAPGGGTAPGGGDQPSQGRPGPLPGALGQLPLQLRRLLSRGLGDLETEDLLLMLILYLLYRESGDRDWLMTLGAMLFV